MYIEGEIPNVVTTNGNNGNNGGWNDWSWIIGLAIIGALFGGFGGNGFGGGNRGGFGGFCLSGTPATQADLANGFAQNTLQRGIDDIILGQAQMQNFINQGFAGTNSTITNGFANLNTALCSLGYNQAQLVNGLSTQLADCCCKIERGIDSVNFNAQRNTCDIIRAGQDNTRAILDFLTNEKIEGLRAENTALKGQISNDRQSRFIINELRDGCPIPAYLTCNPKAPYGYGYPYGYSNYGSGCCGASVQ